MKLKDRVAIVTGAGSGIGKASALLFAKNGAKVGVLSHTEQEVYETIKEIHGEGGQALALELARWNVRVNVICPGSVETEIGQNTEQRDTDKVKINVEYETRIPLSGKPATSNEVAELALFLASDESRHITGTPIWIDGAQSLLQG